MSASPSNEPGAEKNAPPTPTVARRDETLASPLNTSHDTYNTVDTLYGANEVSAELSSQFQSVKELLASPLALEPLLAYTSHLDQEDDEEMARELENLRLSEDILRNELQGLSLPVSVSSDSFGLLANTTSGEILYNEQVQSLGRQQSTTAAASLPDAPMGLYHQNRNPTTTELLDNTAPSFPDKLHGYGFPKWSPPPPSRTAANRYDVVLPPPQPASTRAVASDPARESRPCHDTTITGDEATQPQNSSAVGSKTSPFQTTTPRKPTAPPPQQQQQHRWWQKFARPHVTPPPHQQNNKKSEPFLTKSTRASSRLASQLQQQQRTSSTQVTTGSTGSHPGDTTGSPQRTFAGNAQQGSTGSHPGDTTGSPQRTFAGNAQQEEEVTFSSPSHYDRTPGSGQSSSSLQTNAFEHQAKGIAMTHETTNISHEQQHDLNTLSRQLIASLNEDETPHRGDTVKTAAVNEAVATVMPLTSRGLATSSPLVGRDFIGTPVTVSPLLEDRIFDHEMAISPQALKGSGENVRVVWGSSHSDGSGGSSADSPIKYALAEGSVPKKDYSTWDETDSAATGPPNWKETYNKERGGVSLLDKRNLLQKATEMLPMLLPSETFSVPQDDLYLCDDASVVTYDDEHEKAETGHARPMFFGRCCILLLVLITTAAIPVTTVLVIKTRRSSSSANVAPEVGKVSVPPSQMPSNTPSRPSSPLLSAIPSLRPFKSNLLRSFPPRQPSLLQSKFFPLNQTNVSLTPSLSPAHVSPSTIPYLQSPTLLSTTKNSSTIPTIVPKFFTQPSSFQSIYPTSIQMQTSRPERMPSGGQQGGPSGPPFQRPTESATIFPHARNTTNMTAELFAFLLNASMDGGKALRNSSSPQYEAFVWMTTDRNLTSYSDQRLKQRYGMATLYFSTSGQNWTQSLLWLSDENECAWFTRSRTLPACGSNGELLRLDLYYNNLGGTLPVELAMLTMLESIYISGGPTEYLRGSLPSSLSSMTKLTELYLQNNKLTGTMQPVFGNLTLLRAVDLSNNKLTGTLPPELGFLVHLETFGVSFNSFGGAIPQTIADVSDLRVLLLNDNQFTSSFPSNIGESQQFLRQLRLDNNLLTSTIPTTLGLLQSLKVLTISGNHLIGSIPSQIGSMIQLVRLSVARNKLSGTIPSQLCSLKALTDEFDLSENVLTGPLPDLIGSIGGNLREMKLNDNQLSGTVPFSFANLVQLNLLRLDRNNLTGIMPAEVCALFNSTLPSVFVDCAQLECACCNYCCQDGNSACTCRYFGTYEEWKCYF